MQFKPFARVAKRRSIITGILLATGISLATILPTWARPARLTAQLSTSEINVRVNPSTQSDIAHRGNVGDRVDLSEKPKPLMATSGITCRLISLGREAG
jgi:hypothetical protein